MKYDNTMNIFILKEGFYNNYQLKKIQYTASHITIVGKGITCTIYCLFYILKQKNNIVTFIMKTRPYATSGAERIKIKVRFIITVIQFYSCIQQIKYNNK